MFHKKLKQMGAWLLAFSMVLGSAQLPAMEAKASDTNLALSATASASSVEASSLPATQANDGSDSTRWASDVSDDAQTLQLSWDSVQTMKSFVVKWERRNATEYAIETSNDGSNWTTAASFSAKPEKTVQEITLDNPVQAQYVRLNIKAHSADGAEGETSWNNVSVYEFEVYEGDIPDNRTEMEKLIDSIEAPQISADGTHISMPELPEGVTVRFCADYEQVIGEDGTIYQPLEDKVVKGFYEVSDGNETAETSEYTITVPGQYTDSENANRKPSVIPEIQEWHGTAGQFGVSSSSRIIAGEGLEDTAARFAEDYKEITGLDISVVKGSSSDAKLGDFCLTLADDTQGLGEEGYIMTVGNFVKIEAADTTGAYWGAVSILQILKQTNGTIAKGIARDYPKYEVRGFSLDVARKPFTIDTLNEFAKNMAWYKMNSFQVHLSDNLIFMEDYYLDGKTTDETLDNAIANTYSGFRLESGIVNEETGVGLTSEDVYYTKAEFQEFIKNSQAMGVAIVPEFDMPAHAFAITKVFPQYMSRNLNGRRPIIDELDLTQEASFELAKSIWDDFILGEDAVFKDVETIHIGTDEYHGAENGNELFRRFSQVMINYAQSKGKTVRMWGSLSNKSGTTPVPYEDVQLNVWNTGYSVPKDMHEIGYDMINTLDGFLYMVPNGKGNRIGYGDYLNRQSLYTSWEANNFGGYKVNAGDDQMLGAVFAIWHDNIDTRANGISQYDSFARFMDAMPAISTKVWSAPEKSWNEFLEQVDVTGTAPGTTIYGETESLTETILDYTFDETVEKDSTANGYNAEESKNVSLVNSEGGKALQLNGGESYVTTPLNKVGSNASITMKVKMDADAEGEQILCESKDTFGAYGTYAFKAVQARTGKVGFSREGYDFSFDYELPANEWVELTFQGGEGSVSLYVNGELVDNDPDIYYANHPTTELTENIAANGAAKVCTMLVPIGRIGSTTKSFKGQVEYVTVSGKRESSIQLGAVSQEEMTAEACSVAPTNGGEGPVAFAIDGDGSTYWHSNWNSDTTITDENPHWFKVTLANAKVIDKLTYLPRQDGANGRIFTYSIEITKPDGTTELVAEKATWANDASLKTAEFEPIEAKSVKLLIYDAGGDSNGKHATIAELNLYETVSFESSDLQAEINKYSDYSESGYTPMSWNTFARALEEALGIVNSTASTKNDYLYAYEQLQKAAAALAEKPVDNRLYDVIEEAAQVKQEDYAPTGYAAYQRAVANAVKVLEDESATDAQKLEAAQAVEKAKAALVPKAQGEKLNTAIANAEKLLANTAGYTAASVAALQKAVADAKAVLANPDATQAQIDAALKALQEAKLVKADVAVQEPNPNNPGNPAVQAVPKAGTVTTVKDVQYKVTKSDAKNGTVAVVKMAKKTAKKIVIPSSVTIDGYTFKVTAINAKVFQKAKKLTTVTVGANVKKIGAKAFYKCTKLKKVIFKGVKAPAIGKQAFKGTAAKCKVTTPKKMVKKQRNLLKTRLKKAGLGKKATVK